jgi:phenylacetate-coenzyme A ligase PaaK-like adenylate-forming protein
VRGVEERPGRHAPDRRLAAPTRRFLSRWSPHLITSEQLTNELSGRIAAGFGAPPASSYATSEGLVGSAPPSSDVFSFAGDLAVVEFVDADDRPVPAGDTAHHVLVTNLFNHIQPLIRYRLDDRMIECPPSADHGQSRARLQGRTNETHMVGGATIHPLTSAPSCSGIPR